MKLMRMIQLLVVGWVLLGSLTSERAVSSQAATRLTSSLQSSQNATQTTRRVTVRHHRKLHVVLTAYQADMQPSRYHFHYGIYRSGQLVKRGVVTNGHTVQSYQLRPGKYSLRVSHGSHQVTLTGGISSSNTPHFV
ncbi:hypothetical protein [Secundilactobacillus similis]|uniref:Uncharacterized protein n=1 Tax=Secundilactobacillus similis DSM 23365 = JCM 2765 TaxID=1423804 RepID=A0A0R2FP64_9LACO|nr:hypothetical protein [Secundilactobacillus similis]KRN26132.1 hypothetical protein FD14_GL003031 [Secundilactobacillus similis DSM 23365 = JCM 2765]